MKYDSFLHSRNFRHLIQFTSHEIITDPVIKVTSTCFREYKVRNLERSGCSPGRKDVMEDAIKFCYRECKIQGVWSLTHTRDYK